MMQFDRALYSFKHNQSSERNTKDGIYWKLTKDSVIYNQIASSAYSAVL